MLPRWSLASFVFASRFCSAKSRCCHRLGHYFLFPPSTQPLDVTQQRSSIQGTKMGYNHSGTYTAVARNQVIQNCTRITKPHMICQNRPMLPIIPGVLDNPVSPRAWPAALIHLQTRLLTTHMNVAFKQTGVSSLRQQIKFLSDTQHVSMWVTSWPSALRGNCTTITK